MGDDHAKEELEAALGPGVDPTSEPEDVSESSAGDVSSSAKQMSSLSEGSDPSAKMLIQAFSLVPVQDDLSDQSNTAPKKVVLRGKSVLGRNPFTGVMDALVSRELLELTVKETPCPKCTGGKVLCRALRAPNKITLNGTTCFDDTAVAYEAEVGDRISLYGQKYRYTLSFGSETKEVDSSSLSVTSKKPVAVKLSGSNFGVKVAPAEERSQTSKRRKSSAKGDRPPALKELRTDKSQVNYLAWAFFVVLSGCLITVVIIFARSSEHNDSKDTEGTRRLRGAGDSDTW